MNKKFFIVSVFALMLGTTTVMADNHKFNDGPKKPQKEVVNKPAKNDKMSKPGKQHAQAKPAAKPAPKPVAQKAPAKPKPVAHAPRPHRPEPKPACPPSGRCHKPSPCHCHGSYHHHRGHCKPLPPCPVRNHVRVVPPIAPFQVTVRI